MEYTEMCVKTTKEGEELVASVFYDYCDEGISIDNINDLINLNKTHHHWDYIEDDIFAKYTTDVLVRGCVLSTEYDKLSIEIYNKLEQLRENSKGIFDLGSLEITTRKVERDDWLNTWKEHFKPIHIKDVVICPKWIDYQKQENEKVVLLNVGMAFGTGEHETTSMVIELLQDFDLAGKKIVDIGCGSGILGITAIKLGAKFSYMSDIDKTAVEASLDNAKLNGVTDFVEVTEANLLDKADFDIDLCVSNITAEVLIMMATDMAKLLKSGTPLLLSGILSDRMGLIEKSYGEYFDIKKVINKGDWCGVTLYRK